LQLINVARYKAKLVGTVEFLKGSAMNTQHYHAVVWIDHREARVFHFTPIDVERLVLHPDHPTRHIHHKAGSIGSGHAAEDHAYLQAVAESIADPVALLITGPANEKTELVRHIREHIPKLMSAIVGVETVDHPSDAQLVAYARKHFKATDRMLPQAP
jgi:stalled ribosome rescue protein Dom34